MSQVFISYRRGDCPYAAHLIWYALASELNDYSGVFLDDQRLRGGELWDDFIRRELEKAYVVVVVVGKKWAKSLIANEARARQDYLREELAYAVSNQKQLLPVIVDGAGLPDHLASHEVIGGVLRHQFVTLRASSDFPRDMAETIDLVKKLTKREKFKRDLSSFVRAGKFTMGTDRFGAPEGEGPGVPVHITRSFRISKLPVTIGEFQDIAFEKTMEWSFTEPQEMPAHSISWRDAIDYCNLLSDSQGLPPFYTVKDDGVDIADPQGEGYRLPTEAEWEYACRYGSDSETDRWSFGDDVNLLRGYAHVRKEDGQNTEEPPSEEAGEGPPFLTEPKPVGSFDGNRLGLKDMYGNVWEWVWDAYELDRYLYLKHHAETCGKSVVMDPQKDRSGIGDRVVRGGSFRSLPAQATSTVRWQLGELARVEDVGFRVARSCGS